MLRRFLLRNLFSDLVWHVPTKERILYLTFDDGPVPEATPWVISQLASYRASATFFCVGDNVQKHPGIYQDLLNAGHAVGNHTMHHLNGWKTPVNEYLDNTARCALHVMSTMFRPPYGKLKRRQLQALREKYAVVMWDVLSRDYDVSLTGESCAQSVIRRAAPGSIVVFHDSIKAFDRLKVALPAVLRHFSEQGYRFEKLTLKPS